MAIKGRRSTPEERLRAVQLLKEGNEADLVARMFGVSRAIVFRWQQKYDAGGPVALETKKTRGPVSMPAALRRTVERWFRSWLRCVIVPGRRLVVQVSRETGEAPDRRGI